MTFISLLACELPSKETLVFLGSLYIAPVIGSTINMPINPPNKIFPQYQPLMLGDRVAVFVS